MQNFGDKQSIVVFLKVAYLDFHFTFIGFLLKIYTLNVYISFLSSDFESVFA